MVPFINCPLIHIYNLSLKNGIFPKKLKLGIIKHIFKGDKYNTTN